MALTRPNYNNLQTNAEVFTTAMPVLHGGATSANVDIGFLFNRANGLVSNVALYWSESAQSIITAFTNNTGITNSNISITSYAPITTGALNVNGNLTVTGTTTTVNTVDTNDYVSTVNATNVYATTIGNIGANMVGTGTYLTSLNASNLSSGTVSASLIPTLNQNTTGTSAFVTSASQPNITTLSGLTSVGTAGVNTTYISPAIFTNNNGVVSVQITGTATRGGAGYHDFLSVTNQGGGTNPNKTIRLDNAGTLQIINSTYSNNIFNLTDSGDFTIPGKITTNALYTTTGLFWTGNGYPISTGGGGSVSGTIGQIQYNNNGAFGATPLYYWSSNSAITTTSAVGVGALTATSFTGAGTGLTSIPNSALTNSSVTIGSTAVALGATVATVAGLTLTSPTLTTPALGTPSSGNFSTGTFTWPTFNQNTTGSAATAGTVTTASQPSVTTLAGLTSLGTTGVTTTALGNFAINGNLTVTGTQTFTNTETVTATEYVSTVNATNLYSGTIGNIGANMVGTGTYLTSLNASNLSSGTVNASLIPTLNQNTTGTAVGLSGTPNITVGTIVSGTITPNANASVTLGSTTAWWSTVYGKAIQAQYADLAECYASDLPYPPGTVVVFGGSNEITTTLISHDPAVAGVISTDPAYLMNASSGGLPVALTGRVPCRVQGPVSKGTVLVTSTIAGVAQAIDNSKFLPGCVVGKALEAINTNTIETIEVVVGRF